MTKQFFDCPAPFLTKAKANNIALHFIAPDQFDAWLKKQTTALQNQAKQEGFNGKSGQVFFEFNESGTLKFIHNISTEDSDIYTHSALAQTITKRLDCGLLEKTSFTVTTGLKKSDINDFCIGWALAAHHMKTYKSKADKNNAPRLIWPKGTDKTRVNAFIQAICMLRNLVNTPANDLGPDELEKAVKMLAKPFEAKVSVIKDQKILEKDFPLIYTVGKASPRAPRLIDLQWGNAKHPKVTLVGKGVCFDTGGLDIKTSSFMALMKKDMGGAAHVMGVAHIIMALKLPISLRVLIPAVENSIAGNAFRPGDIIKSRKGLTVENTNTDAEGRLILADALTYACEAKPDVVIDFATLTGSARAALGPDIPAMFGSNDKEAKALEAAAFKENDPVWQMPLWDAYKKHIESSLGDLVNSAGLPGDLIYSALFLKEFVTAEPDWFHLDVFAWEQSGKAGRPKGASDTGLRAVFSYLENRFGK